MIFGISITSYRQKGGTVDIRPSACWVEALNWDEAFGIATRLADGIVEDGWKYTVQVGNQEIKPEDIEKGEYRLQEPNSRMRKDS